MFEQGISRINDKIDDVLELVLKERSRSDGSENGPARKFTRTSDYVVHRQSVDFAQAPGDINSDDEDFVARNSRFPSPRGPLASAADFLPGKTQTSLLEYLPYQTQDVLNIETISKVVEDSLASVLYPKDHVKKMLNVFFKYLNIQRYPLPRSDVLQAFDKVFNGEGRVTPSNISSYSLIIVILALCTLYVFVSQRETVEEFKLDNHYYDLEVSRQLARAAELANHISQSINREDQNSVLSNLMMTRYFFVTGLSGRSWTSLVQAVRISQALNLHRDGTVFHLDETECERRRLIWALVYSAAQTYSLGFGRPPLIIDTFCDTMLPQLTTSLEEVPKPLHPLFSSCPPPIEYGILKVRAQFAKFIGQLSWSIHNVQRVLRFSRIMELSTAFEKFVSELPFYFQVQFVNGKVIMNEQCDEHFKFLKLQRFHLWVDILFYTLSLHCPLLLCMVEKGTKVSKYVSSYDICLRTVKFSLAMRQKLLHDDSNLVGPATTRDMIASFRWFNTVVVAGLLLVISPKGPDAALLRSYLHEFIERREKQRGQGRDAMLEKDISIIRSFLLQADEKAATESEKSDIASSVSSESNSRNVSEILHTALPLESAVPPVSGSSTTTGMESVSGGSPWCTGETGAAMNSNVLASNPYPWSFLSQGVLDPSMTGISSEMDTTVSPLSVSNNPVSPTSMPPYVTSLNLGSMYRIPTTHSTDGLSQQTLMPIWPMNAGYMPNASQAFEVDFAHQNQDTQELLNLW